MTALHVADPPTAGAPETLGDLARRPPAWCLNLQAAGGGRVVLASERRPATMSPGG